MPKKLEKKMTFEEVKNYLSTHKKYRLLTKQEFIDLNIECETTFIDLELEDNRCHTHNLINGEYKEGLSSTLFKFSVYLAYSDAYIDVLNRCEQAVEYSECELLEELLEFIR